VSYPPPPTGVDYAAMSPGDCWMAVGDDAVKWTDFFQQVHPSTGLDRGTIYSWMCNILMAGHDGALAEQGRWPAMSGPYT
jgi:hypothetical protein